MTGFEADQGFVSNGDDYVALDIGAIPGLQDKLGELGDLLQQRHAGANFTLVDLTHLFIRQAVQRIEIDDIVPPQEPASMVA